MALIEFDMDGFNAWLVGRPAIIQALAARIPPDRLYCIKSTGQRVTLHSYSEGGTVTVNVTGQYNLCAFDTQVFGLNPDNLEECDLPGPDEELGSMLIEESAIKAYVDEMRPAILAARGIKP